jgi:CBS domain-containing protein
MHVKNVMTASPAYCTPETKLQEAARLMIRHDCGAIPVVESRETLRPVGIVTDRDIVCRAVAYDRNPVGMRAMDCMSSPVVVIRSDALVDDCCQLMEDKQVRRIVVVDENGECCGIVSMADIARNAPKQQAAKVLRDVSQPSVAVPLGER